MNDTRLVGLDSFRGAPGVDALTIADIEADGVEGFLDVIEAGLRDGSYRPQPVRRVWIPKPGKAELRPLGVAAVGDRVVQAALRIVLEPILEADFLPCSYGFRPKRSAHQALQAMRESVRQGRVWVVDADIESFFDRLGFDLILDCLREWVSDRKVLRLVRMILETGVLDGEVLSHPGEGAPQGGPLSPLLANAVLHCLDRAWQERHRRLGVLICYADDEVILCPTKERAEAAMAALAGILADLGLNLSASKTRIVCVAGGEEHYDFLGFHHRMVPSHRNPNSRYSACWPSDKKMAQARSRIRELTGCNRRHVPTHKVVADLNDYLRGWRQYYRFGSSTRRFAALDEYVVERMALLLSKRHGRRGRGHGLKLIIGSGNRLGLERLTGTIDFGSAAHAPGEGRREAGFGEVRRHRQLREPVTGAVRQPQARTPRMELDDPVHPPVGQQPRHPPSHRDGGLRTCACLTMNGVGEPCAGEPHAPFDRGPLGRWTATARRNMHPTGTPAGLSPARPTAPAEPAAYLTATQSAQWAA